MKQLELGNLSADDFCHSLTVWTIEGVAFAILAYRDGEGWHLRNTCGLSRPTEVHEGPDLTEDDISRAINAGYSVAADIAARYGKQITPARRIELRCLGRRVPAVIAAAEVNLQKRKGN